MKQLWGWRRGLYLDRDYNAYLGQILIWYWPKFMQYVTTISIGSFTVHSILFTWKMVFAKRNRSNYNKIILLPVN